MPDARIVGGMDRTSTGPSVLLDIQLWMQRQMPLLRAAQQRVLELEQESADLNKRIAHLEAELANQRADLNRRLEQERADLNMRLEQERADLNMRIAHLEAELANQRADALHWSGKYEHLSQSWPVRALRAVRHPFR